MTLLERGAAIFIGSSGSAHLASADKGKICSHRCSTRAEKEELRTRIQNVCIQSALVVSSLIGSALVVSGRAAANIDTPPVITFGEGLLILFLINLPINLLLISVFVLGIWRMLGENIGNMPRTWEYMPYKLFLAAVLVTALGAVIDLTLIYDEELLSLQQINIQWYAALLLIFASIFLTSVLVLRIRALPSLIPAVGVTVINLVFWYIFSESSEAVIALLILSLIGVLLVHFALREWMKKDKHELAGIP